MRSIIRFLALWGLGSWASVHAALPAGFIEENVPRPDGAAQWNGVVGVRYTPTGRMFVWERDGRVWIVDAQSPVAQPFLDITPEVGSWRDHGMIGFTLHPNFNATGLVYLLYVVDRHHLMNCDSSQPGPPACSASYGAATNQYQQATIARVTRYRALKPAGDADYSRARDVDYSSRKVLIGETPQSGCPILYESHGAGSLVFGTDGTLLGACGDTSNYNVEDAGSVPQTYFEQALIDGIIQPKENVGAFRAQLPDSLSGKIWRIDPETGDGVAGNPYFDPAHPRAARSRLWVMGLRNPYRMALRPGSGNHDPAEGDPGSLYIGDVGNTWREELNVARHGGENFGWPIFEGMEKNLPFEAASPFNPEAPNPLAGGACAPSIRFRDLIVQDTLAVPSFPNPCNTSLPLPASLGLYVHERPVIEWGHGSPDARWPAFDGTIAAHPQVGQPSPDGTRIVAGVPFGGNTSTAGTFYAGNQFPSSYQGSYFHGDYGAQWIRNFVFDENDFPVEVRAFGENLGGVVGITEHPVDGSLYYIAWATFVRRISYVGTGNRAPIAVAGSNVAFGASPLTVQLSAAGSSDPEGQALTYEWDFGDGSPHGTGAQVTHIFTAPGSGPASFNVRLTVRDPDGAAGEATLVISPNNTPPAAYIVVPPDGYRYAMDSNTVIDLLAVLDDAETGAASLSCRWLNVLHHNEHTHEDSVIESCSGTTVVSPLGCGSETYFFEMRLEVTDPQGLVTRRSSFLHPRCDANAPPIVRDDSVTLALGGNAVIPVLANDTDDGGIDASSVQVIAPARRGTATLQPGGSILYQHGGASLPDEFYYTVKDLAGVVSNAGRVRLLGATDSTPPSVPMGLTATAASATQVNLAWSASTDSGTGVAGYRIRRGGVEIGTTSLTSWPNTGLTPGTTYQYSVSAFDGASPVNESAPSAAVSVTTPMGADVTPPTVPSGLTATPVSPTSINLNWSASTDAGTGVVGYRVFRNGTQVASVSTTSHPDTGLTAGTAYSYRIAAYDAATPANVSAQSAAVQATTPGVGSGGTLIRINAGGPAYTDTLGNAWEADRGFNTGYLSDAGSAAIDGTLDDPIYRTQRWGASWTAEILYHLPVQNGGYQVKLHFSENYAGTQRLGGRVFDVKIEGALAHDNIDVYAQAGAGNRALVKTSSVSVVDGAIDIELIHQVENPILNGIEIIPLGGTGDTTPPSVPAGVAGVAVSASQIDLSWSASTDTGSGVAGYRVRRNGTLVATTTATTHSSAGLSASTAYLFTVSAFDAATPANESAASSAISVTTRAPPDTVAPTVPQGLSGTSSAPTQVVLNWAASTDAGAGVAGYRVYRNAVLVGSTASTTYTDNGLTPSTTYSYRVAAYDAATPSNASALSNALSVTTQAAGGGATVIRVNAAGPQFIDAQGRTWAADYGYNTGYTSANSLPIDGTVDDALYQTQRWGASWTPEVHYAFPVPNGSYQVRLHFAETYAGTQRVGARVFDVKLENALVHDNLDVYTEAGAGNRALVKSALVNVVDGQIDIELIHQVENPIINAIEVIQQTGGANQSPDARFTASATSGVAPLSVSFDAGASFDPDGAITGYAWDFGDRTSGSGVSTSHMFTSPGLHVVTLTVTDNLGASDISEPLTVTVLAPPSNTAPIVNAGADLAGTVGQAVGLAGSATDDGLPAPPGRLTYLWSVVSGPAGGTTWPQADQAQGLARPVFTLAGTYVLRLTASDSALTSFDDVTVTIVAASGNTVIRVNAAGPAYIDSLGQSWSADYGFNTGYTSASGAPIAGTVDDALYQTQRWGASWTPEILYAFDVPNGRYEVNLHFAESYAGTAVVGARVFDVKIEGVLAHDNVDVFQQAGGANRALVKTANVNVSDGRIQVELIHQVENPIINAIEIRAVPAPL